MCAEIIPLSMSTAASRSKSEPVRWFQECANIEDSNFKITATFKVSIFLMYRMLSYIYRIGIYYCKYVCTYAWSESCNLYTNSILKGKWKCPQIYSNRLCGVPTYFIFICVYIYIFLRLN